MRYFFMFFSFMIVIQCTSKNKIRLEKSSEEKSVNYEIVHQSKFEALGDYSYEILKNQQEVDNLYRYLAASPKGLKQIPIPEYHDNETFIAIIATPKSKNDIEISSVTKGDNKVNIIIEDFENPKLRSDTRWKSLVIIKLLKPYNNELINLIVK